jgi:hypothetical protein
VRGELHGRPGPVKPAVTNAFLGVRMFYISGVK